MTGPETRLRVNGTERTVPAEPDRSLLASLRNDLDLTGTKYGCGEGECGSCTVLLDGVAVRACQIRISEVGHREVVTVEGLSRESALSPVQAAFAELGAFQCGFCTPGMIVRATALLASTPAPSAGEIRAALEGNLCRCGGYPRILRAVLRAAEIAQEGRRSPR